MYIAEVGNQELADGFEIVGHDIDPVHGGGGIRTLDAEACQNECDLRLKPVACGGWSFYKNITEGPNCFLKDVYACCDQVAKQKANLEAVSGYFCNCWSTHGPCYSVTNEFGTFLCPYHGKFNVLGKVVSVLLSNLATENRIKYF